MLHLARASGEDHASTGVPPHSVSTRPIGYPYISRPNSQHTAEKYFQAAPFTLSTSTILQHGWSVRTRICLYLILYEALEDERAQVCYNSIMHAIIPPQGMLYHQSCSAINQLKYHLYLGNIASTCCLKAHGCSTLHLTLQKKKPVKVLLTVREYCTHVLS